jgi:DNA-binding NtrC family response regulator
VDSTSPGAKPIRILKLFIEQCWSTLQRFQIHSLVGLAARFRTFRRIAIVTAILIVEDDVLANEHLEFILQQAGYEVVSATSADEAVALLEDREDVQLIVTDINLPGTMNGLRLATAVKARRPAINIIIVTGYGAPKADEIPPGSLFVSKPYSARKMIEAVQHFQ